MQKNTNQLGDILKGARIKQKLTRDQLSKRIHITTRYLMSIENENKKPSYNVLFNLIRELGISANKIFYPEDPKSQTEREQLLLLLNQCDKHELNVVIATAKALLKEE